MAIHEWLETDGTIVRYDDSGPLIQYLTPAFAPIGDARTPTESETAKHDRLFPPPDGEEYVPSTREAALSDLRGALTVMRNLTADMQISEAEAAQAVQTVFPPVLRLRTLAPEECDAEVTHVTFMLLSQIMLAIYLVGGKTGTNAFALASAMSGMSSDMGELDERVANIETFIESITDGNVTPPDPE